MAELSQNLHKNLEIKNMIKMNIPLNFNLEALVKTEMTSRMNPYSSPPNQKNSNVLNI